MKICIVDCNHGFWEPEKEEAERLSQELKKNIQVVYQNCTQDNLVERCQQADIIAVQRLKIDGRTVAQLPNCKVVVRLGVGLDNIVVNDLQDRGIKVISFPSFCTEEVANHTLSLILFAYRRLDVIIRYKSKISTIWGRPVLLQNIRKAAETTIGIVGLGRIGAEVIKRLKTCGFNAIGHDPYINEIDIKRVSLEELFATSDIVSIHCSLTDETRNMVDSDLLQLMKRDSVLINTARGDIVNSKDLQLALDDKVRMAYVDVFDPEPIDEESLKIDNLYITPHIAFYSWDSLDYLKREFVRQSVKAFLAVQSGTSSST